MNCEWPDCDRPARRSDQERREAQPDDKWMILCEEHDAACNGSVPARNTPKEVLLNRQQKSKPPSKAQLKELADTRLEYVTTELRVDIAVGGRVYNKQMIPPKFAWLSDLNDATVEHLLGELAKLKSFYGRWIYRRDGLVKLREGIEKYQSVLGTYQLMASVKANYTGKKEEVSGPVASQ